MVLKRNLGYLMYLQNAARLAPRLLFCSHDTQTDGSCLVRVIFQSFNIYLLTCKNVLSRLAMVFDTKNANLMGFFCPKVSILAPALAGRPIVNIRDIAFEICTGKNVLCVSPDVNLSMTYSPTFSQSGNIQAFMSVGGFE